MKKFENYDRKDERKRLKGTEFQNSMKKHEKCCNLWKMEKIANMHQELYYSSKIQVEHRI